MYIMKESKKKYKKILIIFQRFETRFCGSYQTVVNEKPACMALFVLKVAENTREFCSYCCFHAFVCVKFTSWSTRWQQSIIGKFS